MEHALFLDKPIRGNPRDAFGRRLTASKPSSSPDSDTQSSVSSSASSVTASHDPDLPSTSPVEQSIAENMAMISCMTRPQWRTEAGISEPQSCSDQAASDQDFSTTATDSQQQNPRSRKKTVKAACLACQKRKSKCDGKRPRCTSCRSKNKSCEYMAEEGVSSQAASKRRLEGYGTVLLLLQQANSNECERILKDLRGPRTLGGGVKNVLDRWKLNFE
ncbi:hypothetical protein E4T49_03363 [Aureobasidium sp. EXF-10728]|nr:hypothetical protein E4T49_03363 [Aureobasidium sp. EXF-10728]